MRGSLSKWAENLFPYLIVIGLTANNEVVS